jgi:hypothetical protein
MKETAYKSGFFHFMSGEVGHVVFLWPEKSISGLYFVDAIGADVLALITDDIFRIIAKNAGRLVLFEDDAVPVHKDFQRVAFRNIERAPHFDRQHDTAELVNLSDDPC